MRNNIIIGAVALVLGLIGGFFLFGGNTPVGSGNEHQHDAEILQTNQGAETVYTCSMHPQIRQNEPGLCPICAMDLITLDATNSGNSDPLVLSMTEEAVKLANIQTSIIGGGNNQTAKSLRLSGKVQADERLAVSLSAHVPGRIEKLYVSFTGEQVRKGQKLADIYSPELITAQRELFEAKKLQNVSPALLEAARKKLKYWKVSDTQIQAIEDKEEIQETFSFYAEESGIVNKRRVSLGDYVKQGQALFDLINLNKVWVVFDAYEEDLANISLGDQIEFTTPSIPNQEFQARITFIDPVINPSTRITALRTEVGNYKGLIKPEMLVMGSLSSQKQAGKSQVAIAVPKSAVLWTGKRSVVYVKIPDETIPSFQYREVELGESLGESYQVLSGLELGEEIVTYGNFAIDAAAQLNNQVSMMNKNVVVKDDGAADILPDYTETTPLEFKEQLGKLAEAYFGLKDALVATNPEEAVDGAKKILENMSTVDIKLLEGESHIFWMEQRDAIEGHAQKIIDFDDVEAQRKQFEFVSEAMIQSVKVFGTKDHYYIQHCPMALNDQGADWLSKEDNILNPYFGDKMLTCGFVKGEVGE